MQERDREKAGRGTLFIVAAPSGAGKTTLVHALRDALPGITVSISCTTRPKRPCETEGKDYFFIDDAAFDDMVAGDQFLEHKTIFGYRYGTPRTWVFEQLESGRDVILEIDWQGARDVRKLVPGCVGVFILPPAFSELEKRLRSRAEDDDATIRRRMREASNELSHYGEFDYLVINDNFEDALAELAALVRAVRQGEQPAVPGRRDFAGRLVAEAADLK